ncbi:hypothetical protein ACWEBH_09275 [Micrococcus endophyticus]
MKETTMIRQKKLTATAGAALSAALLLTGCTDGGQESPTSETTPVSASESSPAPIPENPLSSSATPIPENPLDNGFPDFEPVTSEQPATDKEATARAFETVELMYEVSGEALRSGDPENAGELSVAATGGMLEREMELVEGVLGKGVTYEGESTVELIESEVAPSARQDGTLIERATVHLVVCEDNSQVKITGKDGEAKNTGDDRFRVNYRVSWNERAETWAVVSTSLPKLDGPEETEC